MYLSPSFTKKAGHGSRRFKLFLPCRPARRNRKANCIFPPLADFCIDRQQIGTPIPDERQSSSKFEPSCPKGNQLDSSSTCLKVFFFVLEVHPSYFSCTKKVENEAAEGKRPALSRRRSCSVEGILMAALPVTDQLQR